MKSTILYLIAFCVVSSLTYCTKSNRMTFQEGSGKNYHEVINDMQNWIGLSYASQVHFGVDSSDSRKPIKFGQIPFWGYRSKFNMHLRLRNNLLLPYKPKTPSKAKISLTCKSENLKSIKLVTALLNEKEQRIRTDTMFVSITNDWNTSKKNISSKGSHFFCLELIAEGTDSTYWNNQSAHVDSTINQNLWIDNIQIELDGKNISQYKESLILEPCRINSENIIPIKDETSFDLIPEMKNKKIIAIGESVHGCEAFHELFFQIVKHQVLYNQCKLILLELDMSNSLPLNSYIQGNDNFDVDSLLYDRRLTFYSHQQLKNMLLFLKDYNKSTDKKVHLIGIDKRIYDLVAFPGHYISEYLYELNKNHNYLKIDTLCYELQLKNPYNNPLEKEIFKLEKDSIFAQMMGDDELKIFSYCCNSDIERFADKGGINLIEENPKLREEFELSREIWMFDNAKYLIDLICGQEKDSKVLIFGHTDHLGFKAEEPVKYTFGHYMKDFYKDQFLDICLVVNEGKFRTIHGGGMNIIQLLEDDHSVESVLADFSDSCLYIPVQSIVSPHIKIRSIGNKYIENPFKIITPSLRFDAILYKKETKESNCLPESFGINPFRLDMAQYTRQYIRLSKKMKLYGRENSPYQ